MTTRVTMKQVEAKMATVNRLLGIENPGPFTVGSVELDGAYGGHRVVKVTSEGHSVTPLSKDGFGTLRQCATFLDGMTEALYIIRES